ncbi:hypothetical protein BFJ68_g17293 [Fusarium oxysporum]|uniref:Uncharacterized protein n=1 Tax=Fusarium oxysporum TaxID=5507 RepID=A0A420NY26_FUSOX|nr:hypothetical protein BFJ68_g17293 [Fusarium oxysporum]
MDEQQLIFRDDDLYNQTAPRKWGHQIQQAPQCIILMARCKLLVSRSPLTSLELSGHGLKYDSLRANIGHCTHMGQEAFRSASEQMGRVAVLTKAMSEVEGTIECIVRYIHKKHGTVRNVRLQSLITSGLRAVDESVNTISHVKENFSQWKYETQNVLRALEEKITSNETQKKEAKRKIVETQRYEETLQKHRQKLEESREVFNEALQDYKDTYNDFRTRAPGVDAVFSAVAALFMNPKLIVAGMSVGPPWTLDRRIGAAQQTISSLNDILGELQNEVQSTADVVAILNKTLEDLTKLQEQIENFLEFLLGIQKIMAVIDDGHDRVLMRNLAPDDLDELNRDPELKRDFLRDADRMKDRFLIASKAAALYNEISDMCIIPGVAWVGGLCFVDSSDDAYEESLLEIQTQERQLCERSRQLITQRVDEIGIELKVLSRKSAKSPANSTTKSVKEMTVEDGEILDDTMAK